jgi:hypothetical protein
MKEKRGNRKGRGDMWLCTPQIGIRAVFKKHFEDVDALQFDGEM